MEKELVISQKKSLFGSMLGLAFSLYVAYKGPEIGNKMLMFLRALIVIGVILFLAISVINFINKRNPDIQKKYKMTNIINSETSDLISYIQKFLIIIQFILLVMIAVKGQKNKKLVFQLYGIASLVGFFFQFDTACKINKN